MKVAVVTDAVSSDSYFPSWHKYYGDMFGRENIHVFTYHQGRGSFDGFELGGIYPLPDAYNDDLRRGTITSFVTELLRSHDVVLRVDVDEFLIPDPAKYERLSDFLASWPGTHLTAFGFDIFQSVDEPALDLQRPILTQRRFAYALTALNKTCVTRVPLNWGRGFHYCSLPPSFGDVYLFHTKRADIGLQAAWNERMRANAGGDGFLSNYYSWTVDNIRQFHEARLQLPLITGSDALERTNFNRQFLSSIRYVDDVGLHNGPFEIEPVNVFIPKTFRHFF